MNHMHRRGAFGVARFDKQGQCEGLQIVERAGCAPRFWYLAAPLVWLASRYQPKGSQNRRILSETNELRIEVENLENMIKWFRNDKVLEALKLITRINALASEVQTAAAIHGVECCSDGSAMRLFKRLKEQSGRYEALKMGLNETELLRLLDSETSLWNGDDTDVITWETHLAHFIDCIESGASPL